MNIRANMSPITQGTTHMMRNWPGKTAVKVPSKISYSQSNEKRKQFGYDIDAKSDTMQWTKLDLDPKSPLDSLKQLMDTVKGLDLKAKLYHGGQAVRDRRMPKHIAKGSAEIVQDYLTKVIRTWTEDVRQHQANVLQEVPIDIVVTHPAVGACLCKHG